jgi:hypothetical protein
VRYALGFYIPEDGIVHSSRRGNLQYYQISPRLRYSAALRLMVRLSVCLTLEALLHEGVWGTGCIHPYILDVDTRSSASAAAAYPPYPLDITRPLREMSIRKCYAGVKRGRCVRLTTSTASVRRQSRKNKQLTPAPNGSWKRSFLKQPTCWSYYTRLRKPRVVWRRTLCSLSRTETRQAGHNTSDLEPGQTTSALNESSPADVK